MLSADLMKSPTHTYIWHRKWNFIPKNVFSHHLSFLLNRLGPFCDTCGMAGASKVACNNKIPAASLGCAPLPAILYMSPGLFEGGSCGSLAAERCVFAHSRTLGMHIHVYTQVAQMPRHSRIHIQRGINVRDQLQGLGYDREECQPRVVV